MHCESRSVGIISSYYDSSEAVTAFDFYEKNYIIFGITAGHAGK